MFTVQLSRTRRAGGFWAAISALVAFCAGSALDSHAQPAPPNDNLLNAQVILGVSGSVEDTNINATVQAGEPPPFPGVPAQSTIWFVWTAPISTTIISTPATAPIPTDFRWKRC
jgi:hypothetical protein